jgi:predicted transcriptional regulator
LNRFYIQMEHDTQVKFQEAKCKADFELTGIHFYYK